jgi:hypothetical protein
MAMTLGYNGHTLEIITEEVDVTSVFQQEPDPDWTETDVAGHRHYRSETQTGGPYPTLMWKPDMVHCRDCHEEEDHGYLVCKQCGEHVQPGYRPDHSRKVIPGLRTYLIDGEPVSPRAAEDFITAMRQEQENR